MSINAKRAARPGPPPAATPARPRSPLWLVVLALACEEPMHPYRMHALIQQRGKDQIANVAQYNSIYQTIDALRRAGLVAVRDVSREERRPERTTYEATEEGRRALRVWLHNGLSTPAREFPEFPAVLAHVSGVDGAGELRQQLEARAHVLEKRLIEIEKPYPGLARLFLLEAEYTAAIVRAEVRWLKMVVDDLRSGRLKYPSQAEMKRMNAAFGAGTHDGPGARAPQTDGADRRTARRRSRR